MYPLAMVVVEAENKDSWSWFLENLIEAIGRPEEKEWSFISNRQKVRLCILSKDNCGMSKVYHVLMHVLQFVLIRENLRILSMNTTSAKPSRGHTIRECCPF